MNILQKVLQILSLGFIITIGAEAHAVNIQVSDLFIPDMLGADIEYLEHRTGPAKNTSQYKKYIEKIYKIDSCLLTVNIRKGKIIALKADLNDMCSFDLNKFIDNAPSANLLTFGKFDTLTRSRGVFMSNCLKNCGNAMMPVIYENLRGARYNHWTDIMVEATQKDHPIINAATKWTTHMVNAEGIDWVHDTKFNCTRTKYDAFAHKVFTDVKIDAITIGYSLDQYLCE